MGRLLTCGHIRGWVWLPTQDCSVPEGKLQHSYFPASTNTSLPLGVSGRAPDEICKRARIHGLAAGDYPYMVLVVDSSMFLPLAQKYKKAPPKPSGFSTLWILPSACVWRGLQWPGCLTTEFHTGPFSRQGSWRLNWGMDPLSPYQTINQLVSWSGVGGPKLGALWADIARCQDVLPLHLSLWGTSVDQQQQCGTAEGERASHRIMLPPAFCLLSQRRWATRLPFPACTPNRLTLTPGSCTLGQSI